MLRMHSWLVAEPGLEPARPGSPLGEAWLCRAEQVSGWAETSGRQADMAKGPGRGAFGPGREGARASLKTKLKCERRQHTRSREG